LWRQNSLDWLT